MFFDSKYAAGVSLGTIPARTHVQLALACQRSTLCAQHRLRLTMQHVHGHTGNLGNECADHAAALVHLASSLATTLPPAGFVIILTHLLVVMVVTASARFWKDCIALEQKQLCYLKWELVVCSSSGSLPLTCTFVSSVILLSAFFFHPRIHLALQEKQWKSLLRLQLVSRTLTREGRCL